MALARVVTFGGVSQSRMKELKREIEDGELPEGMPPSEIVILHHATSDKALAIAFFESDEDYKAGDEILNAMPTGSTPGRRTDVAKYLEITRITTRHG